MKSPFSTRNLFGLTIMRRIYVIIEKIPQIFWTNTTVPVEEKKATLFVHEIKLHKCKGLSLLACRHAALATAVIIVQNFPNPPRYLMPEELLLLMVKKKYAHWNDKRVAQTEATAVASPLSWEPARMSRRGRAGCTPWAPARASGSRI
jgi:hypothetical protein